MKEGVNPIKTRHNGTSPEPMYIYHYFIGMIDEQNKAARATQKSLFLHGQR